TKNLSTKSVASSEIVVARSLERATWPSVLLFLSFCSDASSVFSWELFCSDTMRLLQNGANVVEQGARQMKVGFGQIRQRQVNTQQAHQNRNREAQREQVHRG